MDPLPHLADLRRVITADKCKALLVDLVRVPSPQTALMEAEPLLRKFIETAVEPRLGNMGFAALRQDPIGNRPSPAAPAASGRSLMFITNAMNQPQATMTNAYAGDVADGAKFGLAGEGGLGQGGGGGEGSVGGVV